MLWAFALSAALWPSLGLAAGTSAADYFVHDLPGVPGDAPPIKMHAGHIEVNEEHNANLFFWHFQNQHIANKQRTVIWLNGGPGCSSEDGALMEIGPYRVQKDSSLALNNGSWSEFANLLFVDNPVGTGYSFVDTDSYLHELDEMADDFITFLTKFFALFPEYEQDDLYIAGESYAGQHIPYVAKAILDHNKGKSGGKWNLRGLLIGNGWISPNEQYDAYVSFALEKNLFKAGSDIDKQIQDQLKDCHKEMDKDPGRVAYGVCESILVSILQLTKKGNGEDSCTNMYDVRLKDSYPSCGMNWPPDLEYVTPYLRRTSVTGALNIDSHRTTGWSECSGAVSAAFRTKKSKPSIKLLPDILAEIPVLLFSGAEDLICNHIGTEDLISNMEWNSGKGFETSVGNWAPRRDWTFEGDAAGFWQEARNLTYVQFYDASHMVPFDYPRRTRDMLDRFMNVNIGSIGGYPTDSRIDGDKMPETTVGGASNNTQANQDEADRKLQEAKWEAYRKSGEVVLVILIIVVTVWGYFIWRERRKRATYRAVSGQEPAGSRSDLAGFRRKQGNGDLEASAFDEAELDDLHVSSPGAGGGKYAIGDDSDDETDAARPSAKSR